MCKQGIIKHQATLEVSFITENYKGSRGGRYTYSALGEQESNHVLYYTCLCTAGVGNKAKHYSAACPT